ncbi:hypothetical protein BST61_g4763 [Cercospora zeina]
MLERGTGDYWREKQYESGGSNATGHQRLAPLAHFVTASWSPAKRGESDDTMPSLLPHWRIARRNLAALHPLLQLLTCHSKAQLGTAILP